MKFRYYITDLYDGKLAGTNSLEVATEFALCEDYFVVDSEAGKWLTSDEESVDIQDVAAENT